MISRVDDWRALYPFTSRELRLDGWRYHYVDEGQGEPLLLVHGNPTWSFYWRELIKALRSRYRLIAPDHVGCGLSDKPQEYPYRLAQHIANLRRLIEELDLRGITLLVHDWGGAIGLGTAVQMPERFARFVLFNTATFRSQRCPWRIRVCRTPLAGRLAVQGLNAFARAALSMAVEYPERLTPAVRAGLLAPYDNWANRIATHRFVLDIPLSPAHPSYQTLAEVEAGLAQFRHHPTMLIWGMRDWCFTPHFLQRFRNEFFPAAVVHEVADAGHYVVEDAYERIVPWLEVFLTTAKSRS
jgi:haloalkane dehalogenase